MKIAFRIHLLIAILFMLFAYNTQAQNTQVTVSGIKTAKGQIILNVFKDNKTYDEEQPFKRIIVEKKGIVKGTMVVNCTLEPGIYGITLLDDENKNGAMDKTMIRMPKEGFGFSNFYLEKMKKPSFDDFKVDLKATNNKVVIKVKYM